MIWRCPRGLVVRAGDEYFVIASDGTLFDTFEPLRFDEDEVAYVVDYEVRDTELIEGTTAGDADRTVTSVLERGLEPDVTRATRRRLRDLQPHLPFLAAVLDDLDQRRVVSPDEDPAIFALLADAERFLVEPPAEPGGEPLSDDMREEFHRVWELLDGSDRICDELCDELLGAMDTLAWKNPSTPALLAFFRASLLVLEQPEPPAIDETWVPVTSSLARRVAMLVDRLDQQGVREAADAMETCAALLGYRDGFPVHRA